MTRKSNKSSVILICALIILVIGMAVYICYDKVLAGKQPESEGVKEEIKEDEEENKEEEKTEYLDIYSNQIQTLYNNIQAYDIEALYRNDSVNIEGFKSYAFYMAYKMLVEETAGGNWQELKTMSLDQINTKAKQIFGKDFNVEGKSYDMCPVYKYDNNTKVYTLESTGCGFEAKIDGPHRTLYQATKTNKEINLYESVVYQKLNDQGQYTIYKDSSYNQKINDSICNNNYSSQQCIDNSTKYKFTFQLEDDHYILTSIAKIN